MMPRSTDLPLLPPPPAGDSGSSITSATMAGKPLKAQHHRRDPGRQAAEGSRVRQEKQEKPNKP